jgi:hypothetical protein
MARLFDRFGKGGLGAEVACEDRAFNPGRLQRPFFRGYAER